MTKQEEMEALGFITNETGTIIIDYIGDDTDIVIPEGIVEIDYDAFYKKGITSVKLPKSLKAIRSRAFERNRLTEVDLKNVTVLGRGVFINNPLKKVTYQGETHNINEKLLLKLGIIY